MDKTAHAAQIHELADLFQQAALVALATAEPETSTEFVCPVCSGHMMADAEGVKHERPMCPEWAMLIEET